MHSQRKDVMRLLAVFAVVFGLAAACDYYVDQVGGGLAERITKALERRSRG